MRRKSIDESENRKEKYLLKTILCNKYLKNIFPQCRIFTHKMLLYIEDNVSLSEKKL